MHDRDVLKLATSSEVEQLRTLEDLSANDPGRAYETLAPVLDPAVAASRSGALLAARVLSWLAGEAGWRWLVAPRGRRASDTRASDDRAEQLEEDALRVARRHWQAEVRWRAAVLALARSNTMSTDALWNLVGFATLDLPSDEAWRALGPFLTLDNLTRRRGGALSDFQAQGVLEALFRNPWEFVPALAQAYWDRLLAPVFAAHLAALARTKSLTPSATQLMLSAVDRALKVPDGKAFAAGAAVLAEGGPLADELVLRSLDSAPAKQELARDLRWLGALAEWKSRTRGGEIDSVVGDAVSATLSQPPAVSFEMLEPYAGVHALEKKALRPLIATVVEVLAANGRGRELAESELRWAVRLLAYTTADPGLGEALPVEAILEGVFAHAPGEVFDLVSPVLRAELGGRTTPLLDGLEACLGQRLAPADEVSPAAQRVRLHLEREPRWLDFLLAWLAKDRTGGLSLSLTQALRLTVEQSGLSAAALADKLAPLFPPAALKDHQAECADGIVGALATDPRLDDPAFLDLFAACLAANPRRAWMLVQAATRLAANHAARVVASLLAMLRGTSIPDTLPDLLRSMRDPRIPPAVVEVLPRMPATILPGLHQVLRAHGDASVVPALSRLVKGTGQAARLAKETIAALNAASPR